MPQPRLLSEPQVHAITQVITCFPIKANVHVIAWAKACVLVKTRHTHRCSDKDSYDNQHLVCTSPNFYKHLSLIVQLTHEPCDVSLSLVDNVGHP
jgi:hypothetical protein